MLCFDDAIALLGAKISPLGNETVALEDAAGRFLAEDLNARSNAPRSDVSAMDGYAVRRDEAVRDRQLKVIGEARPGMPFTGKLGQGEALRIFTGGALPDGADCVIMQEYAERTGERVSFAEGHGPARHIREAGSDFRRGELLLAAGTRLEPPAMVTAAAADRSALSVARRPMVAIISTGDELLPPGMAFQSQSGIAESASHGVAALADGIGAEVVLRLHGRDDATELAMLAERAIGAADCVVVIGGASVGDYDLARPMFEGTGLKLIFSRLAIKPGKPVWLGQAGGKPVLGLPGNPTSAMVTARLFLRPLLARLQGGSAARELAFLPVPCATDIPATGDRETFLRAKATFEGLVPATNQASGAQAPLAASDWLIRRLPGDPALESGSMVSALPF